LPISSECARPQQCPDAARLSRGVRSSSAFASLFPPGPWNSIDQRHKDFFAFGYSRLKGWPMNRALRLIMVAAVLIFASAGLAYATSHRLL